MAHGGRRRSVERASRAVTPAYPGSRRPCSTADTATVRSRYKTAGARRKSAPHAHGPDRLQREAGRRDARKLLSPPAAFWPGLPVRGQDRQQQSIGRGLNGRSSRRRTQHPDTILSCAPLTGATVMQRLRPWQRPRTHSQDRTECRDTAPAKPASRCHAPGAAHERRPGSRSSAGHESPLSGLQRSGRRGLEQPLE